MIDRDNAGATGLNHADFDPWAQAHLTESTHQPRLTRDVADLSRLTSRQQIQGENVSHDGVISKEPDGIETHSQVRVFYQIRGGEQMGLSGNAADALRLCYSLCRT